jgi:hypothetical protein
MANRIVAPVKALNKEINVLAGSFSIAASGGAATKVSGLGYSVAKSATGEYTITLEDSYYAVLAATATVQAAVAVDLVAQVKSAASSSVVVNLLAGATPTEPSAVTVVNFVLVMQNSSLPAV